MKFFSYESKFSQLLLKICYSCYLNLLWFVCSLPVVTIGAATTALYYTSLKVIRGEESSLTQQFFHSFLKYYLDTDDENKLNEVIEKASLLCYIRIIRKIRKKGSVSEDERQKIQYYIDKIAELTEKIDSLG